ncbi:pogo transposable element with KRAB domain [Rhizophagus irregularis DAOM 181602=DAOM 197198]|nr:pogo transposable element with KRAB domain [Rhizophagus irregularis DAOM 181602=DAOM 197198]
MVAKTTKCRRVRQAAKYEQDKLAVKRKRVRLAAKYEQAKLATKCRQSKRKKASTSKRSSYSIKQKKQVVAYAKSNGRNEAARHFQLNSSMQFVTRLRIQKSFKFSNIFNMDETPVWFDMVRNFTINAIDGSKLPLICIFKGKRKPRGEQFPDGIIVWFQENSWIDANIMKKLY